MKSFKTFIKEEEEILEKFTHSTHLEDLVLDLGVNGTRAAINALRDFRDAFAGKSNKKNLNLSVKWDGAPAVIFGTDPETGKFFVGSKSIFNKNPKVNYTHDDIKENHTGGLAEKLHDALNGLEQQGFIKLEKVERATLTELRNQLRKEDYHIFHFIGHGIFDHTTGNAVLIMEDENNQGKSCTAHSLSTILRNHDSLSLVILKFISSCNNVKVPQGL